MGLGFVLWQRGWVEEFGGFAEFAEFEVWEVVGLQEVGWGWGWGWLARD